MARTPDSLELVDSKRALIVDAAQQVFEREGDINLVSFRKVAAVAACSHSAPYKYFASKDHLIVALKARAFRWMQARLIKQVKNHKQPRQQLESLSAAYIDAGLSQPQRYALMFFELDDSSLGETSLELQSAKRDCLDVCTQVISQGQSDGSFNNANDALTLSHLFWVAAHGLVSLHVGGQFVMGKDLEELAPLLISSLNLGLNATKATVSETSANQQRNLVS